MGKIEKIIWVLLYFSILLVFSLFFSFLFGLKLDSFYSSIGNIFLVVPVIMLLLHSYLTLNLANAMFFIILSSSVGFIAEYLGINYGIIFGGYYIYHIKNTLFGVPLIVIIYWAVFIYISYCLVNSFFYWKNIEVPNYKNKKIALVVFLILCDGLTVTAIDFFMDPIEVSKSRWYWFERGPYYGIPYGNFLGWFLVVIIIMSIFRLYLYYHPVKKTRYNKSVFITPVVGYGLLALSLAMMAVESRLPYLAIIGLALMLPQVAVNLFLFYRYKVKEKNIHDNTIN